MDTFEGQVEPECPISFDAGQVEISQTEPCEASLCVGYTDLAEGKVPGAGTPFHLCLLS